MRITRRQLAQAGSWIVARGLLIPSGSAGLAANPQATSHGPQASQPSQSAADDLRKSAAAVRKLSVPADTEPAFSFRPQ
jgi:hypothetical protein